jgi:hypothetical protein
MAMLFLLDSYKKLLNMNTMKSPAEFVFIITILSICGIGCQQDTDTKIPLGEKDEKAARMASAAIAPPTYDFQKINTPISYLLPSENPNAAIETTQARVMERSKFLAKSGLPLLDPFTPLTDKNRDWRKADEKYRSYLEVQRGNAPLLIFRRVASVAILKDFALLAHESEEGKQAIAFYTNELFESGGHTNAALVYYCLKALEGTWSNTKIKEYAQRASVINDQSPELAQMRDAPARVEREKATATAEKIKQVEPMVAKLEQIVEEQDKYVEKLRAL